MKIALSIPDDVFESAETLSKRLGVSRSALYRHFSDKQALLAAVGREGFRMLREALTSAWEKGGGGRPGFEAMGAAYVRFAATHPSHYRVMFGVWNSREHHDSALRAAGTRAFQLLVDALATLQRDGVARRDEPPVAVARYVWAVVHGIAMLGIDGRLPDGPAGVREVTAFAMRRLGTGIFINQT